MSTLPFDRASERLVPPVVANKISAVVKRTWGMRLLSAAVLALTAASAVMLIALAIDWVFVPFDAQSRTQLTNASMIAMALLAITCLGRSLIRRVSDLEAAHRIDQQTPELQERWQSLTEFSTAESIPQLRGSETFIRKVAQEAAALEHIVHPQKISFGKDLAVAIGCLSVVAAIWLVTLLADSERVLVLVQRFLSPQTEISLTRVHAESGDIVQPRGSRLKLEAAITGRRQSTAQLFIRQDGENDQKFVLDAANADRATYAVKDLQAPFLYRFRSGDGQTPWHSVRIAERPTLKVVDFKIIPPAYSKLPVLHQAGLPKSVKVLQGSQLVLKIEPSLPLKSLVLENEKQTEVTLALDGSNVYRWQTILQNTLAFRPVLTSEDGLTNSQPPRCEIVVFRDQAPTVEVANPTNEIAVRPDDTVTISFDAKDDLGVSKAELVIFDTNGDGTKELKTVPIPLGEQQGEKSIHAQVDLDLKEFDLKHGQQISYAIRVFDTKKTATTQQPGGRQEPTASNVPKDASHSEGEPQSAADVASNNDSKTDPNSTEPKSSPDESKNEQDVAANESSQQPEDSSSKASQSFSKPSNTNDSPNNQAPKDAAETPPAKEQIGGGNKWSPKSTSSKPAKPKEGGSVTGKDRPEFTMSKMELDTPGQCSSCSRRNIKIDEWAGSFTSQILEKLQLQIDPVLNELKQTLKQAQDTLQPMAERAITAKNWKTDDSVTVRKGDTLLEIAEQKVRDLTVKSDGTPYAFIGLQLLDISQLHIHPARELLGDVTLLGRAAKSDDLNASTMHIKRAIELLEKLTREYEAVKLNQKLAETMTQIKKMHQIFLEGTFAMLKSQKPNLNPKERAFMELELTDEFLRKLQDLLAKKLEIQAELAKILSKDPRLLERFMARSRLEATSLRDQLTLLHGRQRSLTEDVEQALPADDEPKSDFKLKNLVLKRSDSAVLIAEELSQMLDNYVVWTPMKLDVNKGSLAKFKAKGMKMSATASDMVKQARGDDTKKNIEIGQSLYKQLTEWDSTLPDLLSEYDDPKLITHVANRVEEAQKLITDVSGWVLKEQAAELGDHFVIVEVDQHRIAADTAVLNHKLENLNAQCRGISDELATASKTFLKTVEQDLLPELEEAQLKLNNDDAKGALKHQTASLDHFASAEKQLDDIIDGIIKHLDSLPFNEKPELPDDAKPESLDQLLAMLDEEAKAAEGLGIPCCRPSNLLIEKDWFKAGSDPGGGGSGGSGRGSGRRSLQPSAQMTQAKAGQQQADKMKAQLDAALKRMTAKKTGSANPNGGDDGKPERKWDTLGSKLEDHMRQGRGNLPPEQYRRAIEKYFESLSGKSKANPKGD